MYKKLLLFILIVSLSFSIVGCGASTTTSADDNNSNEVEDASNTNENEAEEEEDVKEDFEVTDVEVVNDGFSESVEGIVTNNAKDLIYVEVNIPVYDADGNKIDTALDNINNLGKGETWKFNAMYIGNEQDVTFDLDNIEVFGH